jgi:hypothetical protein
MRRILAGLAIVAFCFLAGCDGDDGRSVGSTDEPSSPSVPPSPSKTPGLKGGGDGDGKDDGKDDKNDKPAFFKVPGGATLFDLPERAAAICAKGPPLKRACPSLVPAIRKDRSYLVDSFGRPGGRFQVLELAAGATTGDFSKNAPPGVSHVVVEVGKPGFIIDLGEPVETSESIDSLLQSTRSGSYVVSPQPGWKWNKKLILAESFPGGGAHGDHLIWEWPRGGYTYRISIHAWTPSVESVRTLHHMVVSIRRFLWPDPDK